MNATSPGPADFTNPQALTEVRETKIPKEKNNCKSRSLGDSNYAWCKESKRSRHHGPHHPPPLNPSFFLSEEPKPWLNTRWQTEK